MGIYKYYNFSYTSSEYAPFSSYSFKSYDKSYSFTDNTYSFSSNNFYNEKPTTLDSYSHLETFNYYKSSHRYIPLFNFKSFSLNSNPISSNKPLTYSPYSFKPTLNLNSRYNFGSITSTTYNANLGTYQKQKNSNPSYTYNEDKDFLANFTRTSGVNINNIRPGFVEKYGVKKVKLSDGREVLACRWSKFDDIKPEWNNALKCFEQAAADLGCDLVYSDMTRTVAESNAARAKKGPLVAKGGHSPHNYGVGTDFILFKDGKELGQYTELYKKVIDRAIELSGNKIESGIYWNKKGERHHIELRDWEEKYKHPDYLVC